MRADQFAVFTRALRDQRRGTLLWALGFAVVSAVYLSYYKQIQDNPSIAASIQNLPKGLAQALNFTDLSSAAGYLKGSVFGLLGPLLMVIFSVLGGTRAIATDEESGVLDVYLANPLSRRRLVAERFGALCLQTLLLGIVVFAMVSLVAKGLGMKVGVDKVAITSFGLVLLGLCFGGVALLVGGVVGRRAVALSVAAGVAVVTYLLNAVVAQIGAISGLKYLSPFHYFLPGNPLVDGYGATSVIVLVAVPLVLLAATLYAFDRRDLNV